MSAGVGELAAWLEECAAEIEIWLSSWVAGLEERLQGRPPLAEAMAYAVLGGGKRLRPALVVASAVACNPEKAGDFGARTDLVRDAACAVELIHCYSLVHDDLPAMDDDDLRRNRPTCHRVYGDALAILAGDALLTDAFSILAGGVGSPEGRHGKIPSDAVARLRLVEMLSRAAGSAGMVGGQVVDVSRSAVGGGLDAVEGVHCLKTGQLLAFSCAAGAEAVGAGRELVSNLWSFGETVGLIFQIADDILDETADPAEMGKRTGKDRERGVATVTGAVGLQGARLRARELAGEAASLLGGLGESAALLRSLPAWLVARSE